MIFGPLACGLVASPLMTRGGSMLPGPRELPEFIFVTDDTLFRA